MILNTQDLKSIVNKILPAIDSNALVSNSETLELEGKDNTLYLNVTNREYFVCVKVPYSVGNDSFHASVDASLFLNLVSKTTSGDIALECSGTSLKIRGNGSYTLPLIYEGDSIVSLPRIELTNPTVSMSIDTEILQSILKYNSKEIAKRFVAHPVQKFYYVDELGAITFTTGACVNKFKLSKPVKMLLSAKVVKLFKLFTGDSVDFTLSYEVDSLSNVQTRVRFEDSLVQLTATLPCDDTLLRAVPVSAIRERVDKIYPYTIVLRKDMFLQAINRLELLADRGVRKDAVIPLQFTFLQDSVEVMDTAGGNMEVITYINTCPNLAVSYQASFYLADIKAVLTTCEEDFITLNFGDSDAAVLVRKNIFTVIPQC